MRHMLWMYFMVLACKRCSSITLFKYKGDARSASAWRGIMLDSYVLLASLCSNMPVVDLMSVSSM